MSTQRGEPKGSTQRAPLQRVPDMSAEEHLRRLRADVDTLLEVQLHGWSDEAWEPLASALVEYGVGVIRGWMHMRRIFEEAARGGFGKVRRCPDSWLDDDTIEELTGETMAKALNYFKYEVLMANRWDASRGASLATFFIGQCKRQFACRPGQSARGGVSGPRLSSSLISLPAGAATNGGPTGRAVRDAWT